MKTTIEMVKEFHEAFGVECADKQLDASENVRALRIDLLMEELTELIEAVDNNDAESTLDALTDIQYVLDGAYLALGFASVKQAAFEEVHRSNMSKLGVDGKPALREDGKILKGPNYTPPNLSQFIV